jgi:hypothetical protein
LKTHFITVDNAWPALKEKGMAGKLPACEAYPVHAFASDLHYALLPNGILTCLFGAEGFARASFDRLLEGLPEASGLQVYSHHLPGNHTAAYLALSAPVAYQCPFAPLQGMGTLFKHHALAHELGKLDEATRITYEALLRCIQGEGGVQLLSNPTPLLKILGPLRVSEASLDCAESIAYNLSYILLGPSRLALLVDFNSFPSLSDAAFPLPSPELEFLSATCVQKPGHEDLARLDVEVEDYLTFLHFFRKAATGRSEGFPSLDLIKPEGSVTLRGKVLAKHYVLLFGTSLASLRVRAQEYFRELCRRGISFHASMIRTRENYCHLYPGNYKVLSDGIRLSADDVGSVLRRVQP